MDCDICKKTINKKQAANHKRWCGKKKSNEFNCESCNVKFVSKRKKKYCSRACLNKSLYTKDFKKKISEGRKKYLKNNPDSHVWKKSNKFTSKPCEYFKHVLKEFNIQFIEEFQPLQDRFFSIDVAFPEIKVGIEINGEQHYNRDKTLKKYYQERHDLITNSGWTLIELHYTLAYDRKKVEEIIQNLNNKYMLNKIDIDFELRKNKTQKKILKDKTRLEEKKLKESRLLKYRLEIIKNFNKSYGWISKASQELGISHTHVRRLINKHMPDQEY